MLPAAHRLRRPDQFRTVLRGRRDDCRLPRGRAGGDFMTVHLVQRPADEFDTSSPQVGFIVSKSVGNAVVRNRTQRRLRHLVAERLDRLPERSDLVVRAHPAAASTTSGQLGTELDRLLAKALRGLASTGRGGA